MIDKENFIEDLDESIAVPYLEGSDLKNIDKLGGITFDYAFSIENLIQNHIYVNKID